MADAIRLDQVHLDGGDVYWTEGRPTHQGRYFVVLRTPDGTIRDVTPAEGSFNVRTRVHEYGGGAFTVDDGTVHFSNYVDQRLYRQRPGAAPEPITPTVAQVDQLRYADAVLDRRRERLICVQEDHTGPGQAVNRIVGIDLSGARAPRTLVAGDDFYSSPRLSPDGSRLAWMSWSHPHMPWISTRLWLADIQEDGTLDGVTQVAGGTEESICQPEWSPGGTLYFVSDRSRGWWNLFRLRDGGIEPVVEMEAELGQPQWQFGQSTYAFESDERLFCAYTQRGVWALAEVDTRTGSLEPLPLPYTDLSQLRAAPGCLVFLGGSPSEPLSLVRMDTESRQVEVIRRAAAIPDEIRAYFSAPESLEFPTEGGRTAFALYYPPRNPDYVPPAGDRAPLLVKSHGGPTAAASNTLSLSIQYWTSRGIGLLDVNYGGSTGFGREYRTRLAGQWGLVDVQDCVNGARFLVERGDAGAGRLAISGGSAGGYTTLRALTPEGDPTFGAGASYYGVSDLEALARDTHKFESRYLDWLIGPYPEARDLYVERSPIHHVDRLSVPVIFFQGAEDQIVPPNQTELMVQALKDRGIPAGYLLFDGEQHGFRRAENVKRALDAELYFYAALLIRSGLHF